MHVISQKRIWDAKKEHPLCSSALDGWYRIMKSNNFDNFTDLKKNFNAADKVKSSYVFNIGGNKLRLIAGIYFPSKKVYVKHILTHEEYSKEKWK